mmetsp:Transcript_81017/g.242711  ORF Transcript_81017/g.242711 Transcript_81017/m.242711 type:complete len:337 (+) Transcript_81017:1439-2449(+)
MTPHHNGRRRARHHVVHQLVPAAQALVVGLRARRLPPRPRLPLLQLLAQPRVELGDPVARIRIDRVRVARHVAVRDRRAARIRPDQPAVNEEVVAHDRRELAGPEQLSEEASGLHRVDKVLRGLVVAHGGAFDQPQLRLPPLELSVGAHRILEHPLDPIRQRVCRRQRVVGHVRLGHAELHGAQLAQIDERRDALRLRHPVRPGRPPQVGHLGWRQLRRQPQLVDIAVAEQQRHARRVLLFERDERLGDAHGAADDATLVRRVATVDEVEARGQLEHGRAVRVERDELQRVGELDKAHQVLPVALDVGDEHHFQVAVGGRLCARRPHTGCRGPPSR